MIIVAFWNLPSGSTGETSVACDDVHSGVVNYFRLSLGVLEFSLASCLSFF